MKGRVLLAFLVIVGLVGGMIWYITSPAAPETVSVVSSDGTASQAGSSTTSSKSKAGGLAIHDISSTLHQTTETGGAAGSTITNTEGSASAIAQDKTPAAKGIHFAASPAGATEYITGRIPIVNQTMHRQPTDNFTLEPALFYPIIDLVNLVDGKSMEEAMRPNQNERYYYVVDVGGQPVEGMGAVSNPAGGFSTFLAMLPRMITRKLVRRSFISLESMSSKQVRMNRGSLM